MCNQVVLIGARGMVGKEQRSLWQLFKVWWTTKNISPYTLVMNNYGIAGMACLLPGSDTSLICLCVSVINTSMGIHLNDMNFSIYVKTFDGSTF